MKQYRQGKREDSGDSLLLLPNLPFRFCRFPKVSENAVTVQRRAVASFGSEVQMATLIGPSTSAQTSVKAS